MTTASDDLLPPPSPRLDSQVSMLRALTAVAVLPLAFDRHAIDAAGQVVLHGFETDPVRDEWYAQLAPLGVVTLLRCVGGCRAAGALAARAGRRASRGAAQRGALPPVGHQHARRRGAAGSPGAAPVRQPGCRTRHRPAGRGLHRQDPHRLGISADNLRTWMVCLQRAVASGQAERLPFSFEADGVVRLWESEVETESDAQGPVQAVLVIRRDISERRRRDEELRRLHATLGARVEGSTDAVFVQEREGRCVVCNQALATLPGREGSKVLGVADDTLFAPECSARLRADDQYRIVQRPGGRVWVEAAPQQGAVFYFTLGPAQAATAAAAPDPR